ncbi:hypothetical protein [Streptosporangium sp. H16]|uniref:hypothetical protein n=1 Tax=Streptosporangium sp. H16 TaxID=3444184 RepID=UPI003F7A4301
MSDISYFEAWSMWLDGKSALGNDLAGMPMIWWGRFGKIGAFVGGMTVVLDVIGPERIREFGVRIRHADPFGEQPYLFPAGQIIAALGAVAFIVAVLTGGGSMDLRTWLVIMVCWASALTLVFRLDRIAKLVASVLENPLPERIIRWVAVLLLVVGFHFDLLAS